MTAIRHIHCVCTNPESGTYLAYDRDEPSDQRRGSSYEEAIGKLVKESSNCPITVTVIDE